MAPNKPRNPYYSGRVPSEERYRTQSRPRVKKEKGPPAAPAAPYRDKRYPPEGPKYEWVSDGVYMRVRALRDFSDVKKGDIGGFAGSPDVLSHYGDCWIYEQAEASKRTRVKGNATLRGEACIMERTILQDNAEVSGNAKVFGQSVIRGNAKVKDQSRIWGAIIEDVAVIKGNALIDYDSVISGDAVMENAVWVSGTKISTGWHTYCQETEQIRADAAALNGIFKQAYTSTVVPSPPTPPAYISLTPANGFSYTSSVGAPYVTPVKIK